MMKYGFAIRLLLGIFAAGQLSAANGNSPFAEDLKEQATYSATFELKIDGDGKVVKCSLGGINELNEEARDVEFSLSKAFIDDACRKLSTPNWVNAKGKVTFYFCLFSKRKPDKAFCEKSFGE
jgi:hypothetical protein